MSMNVEMLFIEVAYADPQNPILKILQKNLNHKTLKSKLFAFCLFSILLFKVFICGEYRSRTDDLLRARQAL